MTDREKAIDFLECRRGYYASLSTDPNPYVKATKVCGYTLVESANACLMAIEALEQEDVLDKIRAEIDKKQYDFMDDKDYDEGIRFGLMLAYQIIDKYRIESEGEK